MKTKCTKLILIITSFITPFFMSCDQKNNPPVKEETPSASGKEDQAPKPDSVVDYAMVNGIRMYYEIHGAGEPLVLIHGGGSTIRTSFGRILPILAETHKIIAVELQAHGHTSDRNGPESFEQDADDVAALLRELHIPKADLLGFSNGGSTSLQVAIRHPEVVNKLVVISAMYTRGGMQPWFWGFMEKGTFNDMPQGLKDAYLEINHDQEKLLNMHNKDVQRMLSFKDWKAEDIKSITAPALIVVGDRDVVRTEHAVEMSRLLPRGRLAIIPGGHGDFIGEIMSPKSDNIIRGVTAMIEDFLTEPAEKS